MKTMINLDELAIVVGGTDAECDFEIGAKPVEIEGLGVNVGYEAFPIIYRADKAVTPEISVRDFESDPVIVCPEIVVPMDPVFRYQPQPKIETGIRLWDWF